jgi:signal transduction histidine kinase/ActR/RegA family two-component response regulator
LSRNGRHLALTLILALAFAACAALAIVWARQTVGVATFWPGTGILMAGLIALPRRFGIACAALCAASQLAINLAVGQALAPSLMFTGVCLGETLLAVWLLHMATPGRIRLNGVVPLLRALILAVAPAMAASAIVAASLFSAVFERNFSHFLTDWLISHLLGAGMVFPAVTVLLQRGRKDDFDRSRLEQAGVFSLVGLMGVLALQFNLMTALLLFFPVLMLAAFRLGPKGAATSALLMAAVSFVAVIYQPDPQLAQSLTLAERVRYTQLMVATGFLTSLTAAIALADHARLRRLFTVRNRTARRGAARVAADARARADFIAAMSHEIRNPLTSIVGFTEVLLRRTDLPETARRQLTMVDRAAAALVGVVGDITDLSRLDSAATQPQPRAATPQAIARDALSIIADRARAKGIGLEQTLAGLVDQPCRVDDLRLRQILLNLLDNALKFTDRGHIRLDVGARLDGERLMLRYAVTDTGVGIEPERVCRLFDHYGHADPERGESWGGSGLGLAVCKRLIELLGGRIGVESIAGRGATFWIEAPAEPIAEAPTQPSSGRLDARVLLVDDNPANRELGATVLDLLGCEVTLAEDGAEALDLITKGSFDVVLMDVHMPRMNGLDATRAIRALPGPAAQIPIIAMTADVLPEQVDRCRAAGMVDHIGKPIRLDDLHAALERWIGKTAQDAANAA